MGANERDRDNLQRHLQEAEARAAGGGHMLGDWERVALPGFFELEATCVRCGKKVQAGYTTLFVAFDRLCPGAGGG